MVDKAGSLMMKEGGSCTPTPRIEVYKREVFQQLLQPGLIRRHVPRMLTWADTYPCRSTGFDRAVVITQENNRVTCRQNMQELTKGFPHFKTYLSSLSDGLGMRVVRFLVDV